MASVLTRNDFVLQPCLLKEDHYYTNRLLLYNSAVRPTVAGTGQPHSQSSQLSALQVPEQPVKSQWAHLAHCSFKKNWILLCEVWNGLSKSGAQIIWNCMRSRKHSSKKQHHTRVIEKKRIWKDFAIIQSFKKSTDRELDNRQLCCLCTLLRRRPCKINLLTYIPKHPANPTPKFHISTFQLVNPRKHRGFYFRYLNTSGRR